VKQPQQTRVTGKGKKRKSTDIIEVLEKQNTEFTTKIGAFHRDKMARFDKLLTYIHKR
jgi:hypothetical protein